MPDQIIISNFPTGLKLDRTAFNIDNAAFPVLVNMYIWRGRAKRKRGTVFVGQLQRQMQSAVVPNNFQVGVITTLNGLGNGSANLISLFGLGSGQATLGSIINSSSTSPIQLTDGTNTFTEPTTPNGTLIGSPGGSGTINYSTGAITIAGGVAGANLTGNFSYFPNLPVMGLRDFTSSPSTSIYPIQVAFDTKYSYQVNQSSTTVFYYDVNYYKNTNNPFVWSGADYQQFWTVNYEGAMWATNNVPSVNFYVISSIVVGATTTINYTGSIDLQTGEYVYLSQITGTDAALINMQSFPITRIGVNSFTIAVNTAGKLINNAGFLQLLTNNVTNSDGIKWYDGDPTSGTGIPTGTGLGWVNFAPPLTASSISFDGFTAGLYYLVGALAIIPFKDRLLFFSPWVTLAGGVPFQLLDIVIWSWNGTPYYNALTPRNRTFSSTAYYVDQAGLGGYLSAGISQPMLTFSTNEDVILVGFGGNGRKTRFAYTGNDLQPFLFFTINTELPSSATFSSVSLDRGSIDIGPYGIAMTDQQSSQRIDLDIPDSVFQIQALNNGVQRINSSRDFLNEWIYFSYPVNGSIYVYPVQTFLYNYRDNTWAILYENFTARGRYRQTVKRTWKTIGFKSWAAWKEPWNAGSTSSQYANNVAGTPQGYVVIVGEGTSEASTGTVNAISNDGSGNTQITSINHCVLSNNPLTGQGDYLYFSGAIGQTYLNGNIYIVSKIIDKDNFVVNVPFVAGAYGGLGVFTRLSQPLLLTKQFPFYWEQGKQIRLGVQKYLLDRTTASQVTVNIYLSQDQNNYWNNDPELPNIFSVNNSLVYSQLLYTCPESTNIGLTPANTNLQMPIASTSNQIWHRFNTSLIGDSVQIGITLSDAQMRNLTYATSEIALHAIQLSVSPAGHLA